MKESKFRIWLSAARPQTLAASIVPVMVGASIAWSHYAFRADTTLVALLCALLIQVGTNFANDYYDFKKGADTDDRIGFERATALGLISPKAMLTATYITMGLAFLIGLYLVWVGGWIILLIGILSLLFGILYTGGPYPLGYNGLGDIFVFIFFGIIAVMGTYYVNALEWSTTSFLASLPVGALCVNILVVNNLRDIDQDKVSGKRTLGVLFGEKMLKMEYLGLLFLAFLIPVIFYHFYGYGLVIMLPYLSLPLGWRLIKQVYYHQDKRNLNKTLERTAQFMILFGFLFSVGIIL
ncbi:MAG: 1,4-dihydroxy-2-naphthoate polyprenyltransferase [Balneolaceae bacterium]|nr:1,4-dihydroxy-2-naphthoate polyprenyltransferase [Balneolaceae bacterium]MDR9408017.1 1,4-dihydroxy-2-naphthoate polyprenyltransferase [Balneolaceae bacterium]